MTQIVPVTDFIRNFGKYFDELPKYESIVLTRDGWPLATIKASRKEKRKLMQKAVGTWKGTALDSDKFWKGILERKSKIKPIDL